MQTQDDLLNLMNQFLADLAAMNIKLHSYHWNVVGPFFEDTHKKTEEYYSEVTKWYDLVAERIKMYGGYPLASLKSYSVFTKIKDIESKDYYETEILKSISNDFTYLLTITSKIEQLADKSGDSATIDLFTQIIIFLEKNIWFIRAKLK